MPVEIQALRRHTLRQYIRQHFPSAVGDKGNVSAFANAVGMKQSAVADTLDGRKSFGEKLALRIEQALKSSGRPVIHLTNAEGDHTDRSSRIEEPRTKLYGHDVSEEAVMFAKEWERLPAGLRAQVQALVHMMVAELVRDSREKRHTGPKTSISTSKPPRPHA